MNRLAILNRVRVLADELTEAPRGLYTDTQIEEHINTGLENIQMELLEFMPWYFRKRVLITLVQSQQDYNISSDLGIDGNIVITTANQKLNFDEGGAELTATITAATYTPTTLCTEIKTQLDAAGALTYTVTYSGKVFRISSTAGTLNLLCSTGTDVGNGIWSTIGFAATDRTGFINYAGDYAIDVQNFLMFEGIFQNQTGEKRTPLVYLNPSDNFLHETVGTEVAPKDIRFWGYKDVDEIYFVGIPNAAAASQLLGNYFRKIPDLSQDTDVPELPKTTHELVSCDVLRQWGIRDKAGSQGVEGRYQTLLQRSQMFFSSPQGPQPGKGPSVAAMRGGATTE